MTRIRVHGPDIDADVSAEQVAAYLLANGHTEHAPGLRCRVFHDPPWAYSIEVPTGDGHLAIKMMTQAIERVAAREFRHPSAVLADIVGPAVGVAGVACATDPRRCYRAPRHRPCTTEDIQTAIGEHWPAIASAVGYVGDDPYPLVDGWMGVGFSVRLFGSASREAAPGPVASRVAMDALMVSLARAGFAVSHDGNEWQEGRLVLGWADEKPHGAGEESERG
jgi:hypothetical protein